MVDGNGVLSGDGAADVDMLHLIAQEFEHGDAYIVGTPEALRYLRAAIDAALTGGVAVVERGTMPNDGEGFWLTVHAVSPEAMAGMPLPYAETRDGRDIPEWLNGAQEKAVAAFLERRKGGSVQMPETKTVAAGAGRREWLVIGSSKANSVFASDADRKPRGYIPRDVAEVLLGRDLGGNVWFTEADGAALRGHPDWREDPPGGVGARREVARADGFYWVRFGSRPPEVSEWKGNGWQRTGDERTRSDGCTVLSGRLGEPAGQQAAAGGGKCEACPDDLNREAAHRIASLEREVAELRGEGVPASAPMGEDRRRAAGKARQGRLRARRMRDLPQGGDPLPSVELRAPLLGRRGP